MQTPILQDYPHAEENDALLPGTNSRRTHRKAPKALLPSFNSWKANPFWYVVDLCSQGYKPDSLIG